MVKKRDDLIGIITDFPSAKNYSDYNGNPLEESEKIIFDSPLLKKGDGTLSTDPDLDKLRDTVALLANLKEARTNLVTEKTSETGLSANGNALLVALMEQRRNNSIAYQLVNEKDENEERRVDKIFHAYQIILFRPEVRSLKIKKKLNILQVEEINKERVKIDKKVNETKKARDEWTVKMAESFKSRVESIVAALKADLAPGQPGCVILNEVLENNEKCVNISYRTNSSYPNSLGSIVKTGVKTPYSSNPWAHPIYLAGSLPFQMKEFFHEFDKDKLFALVEKKFVSDPNKIKMFKKSFERVIASQTIPLAFKKPRKDWNYWALTVKNYDPRLKSQLDEGKEGEVKSLYVSDVLRIMHILFPQNTPDLDFSDNDFLKDECFLPFINKKYEIGWRGREDSFPGSTNYKEVLNGKIARFLAFPLEKISLSWAGEKDKNSLPQFFWQVYNNPEATQFTAYRGYLDKDGVTRKRFLDGEFTVYENKLNTGYGITNHSTSLNDLLLDSFYKRVKDIVTGKIIVPGHNLTKPFTDKELEINLPDFKEAYRQVRIVVNSDVNHSLIQQVEGIDFAYRKQQGITPLIRENPVGKADALTESSKRWDELVEIYESKIAHAKQLDSLWGAELAKRDKNIAKKIESQRKLNLIKKQIKALETGRIDHLRAHLKHLGDKLTNPSDVNVITYQETIAIRTLIYFLTDLEKEGKLETPLTATEKGYLTRVEQLETVRNTKLPAYNTWQALGASFQERLDNWEKNEGRNVKERGVRSYFDLLKSELNNIKQTSGLSSEEEAELIAINNYLSAEPKLQSDNLLLAFNIDVEPSKVLVDEWRNFGDQAFFKTDGSNLSKIADVINELDDTDSFFFFLKNISKIKKDYRSFLMIMPSNKIN